MSLYLTEDDRAEIDAWTLALVADCRVDLGLAQEVRKSIARALELAASDDLGLIPAIRADLKRRVG